MVSHYTPMYLYYSPNDLQSPEVHNALSATVDSGIRSIFGYASTPILQQWSSDWTIGTDKLPTWWLELLEKLAKDQPFGDGRVQLGLAFDAYYLPKETVLSIFKMVRGLNLKVITSHYVKGPVSGMSFPPLPTSNAYN